MPVGVTYTKKDIRILPRFSTMLRRPDANRVLWLPGIGQLQGATIFDRSGNGNNGTITGATWSQLPSGLPVLTFDGSDDVIDCGAGASLANLAEMTIKAWVNLTGWGQNNVGRILDKGTGVLTAGWDFLFDSTGFLNFRVDYDGATNIGVPGSYTPTLGTWYQVVVTWDGNALGSHAHLYVNSAELSYGSITDGVGDRIDDSASNLRVGNNAGIVRCFNGKIALVGVLNVVWTATQVANNYNSERSFFGV